MLFAKEQEHNARAYCESIGADPDEIVAGWDGIRFGVGHKIRQARWQWYVGAVIQQQAAE